MYGNKSKGLPMKRGIELTPDFLIRNARQIENVLREAYRKAADEHARLGFSVPALRDGKVTLLSPEQVQSLLQQQGAHAND
jgi:hypothetical protein